MNTAWVNIWGTRVGAVYWDESTGLGSFEYDAPFKETAWELAPLQMPLSQSGRIFNFPTLRSAQPEVDTFKGLPGLLADVLPDRFGNELINVWLARNGRPPNSMNPVEMLCFIGNRGMGALCFEPVTIADKQGAFSVELESMVEVSRKILHQKEAFHTQLKGKEEKAVAEILRIGTSAGGARPKAVIAWNEASGEVYSGQADAPEGFEHWLLKLDGVSDIQLGASKGYGRVEMAYYQMAKACGIDMMPSRLLEENDRAHFMTQRFDRDAGGVRHHVQTFCAIKHFDYNRVGAYSYEELFQTMRELQLSYPQAEQMFRRMVFNVMARNCDDHTKNFSFILRKNSAWELAPAYDICHAYQPKHQWVSEHALSINGKRTDITRNDLLAVGKSIGHKKAGETIDEISAVVGQWKHFADEVGVSQALRDEIGHTLILL